ncbi:MAG: hypothetical protein WCP89_01000 [archaeon]
MVRSRENLVGAYAFLVGIILAIILGLFQEYMGTAMTLPYAILVILGIVIGFLNVGDDDSNTFLLASLALVIVAGLGNNTIIFISNISPVLSSLSRILSSLLVLFIPATIIVAMKTVFAIAKV